MSIAGILSSSIFSAGSQGTSSSRQQFQQELQQLGQALQSGNLSAAQSDFASLQQASSSASSSASSTNNPIAQAFSQLSKDLASGNLSAAQKDYAAIKQDIQSQGAQGHHHHHHGGAKSTGLSESTLAQEFALLGQELQAGNLSAAQQAYSAVQQSFAAFGASATPATVQVTA